MEETHILCGEKWFKRDGIVYRLRTIAGKDELEKTPFDKVPFINLTPEMQKIWLADYEFVSGEAW